MVVFGFNVLYVDFGRKCVEKCGEKSEESLKSDVKDYKKVIMQFQTLVCGNYSSSSRR